MRYSSNVSLLAQLILGLALLGCMSVTVAATSTDMVPGAVIAQQLQPTTASGGPSTAVQASAGGALSCPAGYALTAVNAAPQTTTQVEVDHQCNGVAVGGYVHTWCYNDPTYYSTVSNAPTVTYSCQKIQNEWVAPPA